jgi:hypothetical protein
MINTVSVESYNELLEKYQAVEQLRLNDNQYHQVALNLSGRREELEKQAMELIDKHGILKALEITRGNK